MNEKKSLPLKKVIYTILNAFFNYISIIVNIIILFILINIGVTNTTIVITLLLFLLDCIMLILKSKYSKNLLDETKLKLLVYETNDLIELPYMEKDDKIREIKYKTFFLFVLSLKYVSLVISCVLVKKTFNDFLKDFVINNISKNSILELLFLLFWLFVFYVIKEYTDSLLSDVELLGNENQKIPVITKKQLNSFKNETCNIQRNYNISKKKNLKNKD